MKLLKWIIYSSAGVFTFLAVSCVSLPEIPEDLGPQSEESVLPWTIPSPGEGQGVLEGLNPR